MEEIHAEHEDLHPVSLLRVHIAARRVGCSPRTVRRLIQRGDLLGGDEWFASLLDYSSIANPEATTAKVMALWASAGEIPFSPTDMQDLLANAGLFGDLALARALAGLLARNPRLIAKRPNLLSDAAFRLSDDIKKAFEISATSPNEVCGKLAKRLNQAFQVVLEDVHLPSSGHIA